MKHDLQLKYKCSMNICNTIGLAFNWAHSVHPRPPATLSAGGGGSWVSYQVFEKGGGLDKTSIFRGGSWEKGSGLFHGVAAFT